MKRIVKTSLLSVALVVGLTFTYLLYKQKNFIAPPILPPFVVIQDDFYTTSTDELVVVFNIVNPSYLPDMNIGIRYDGVSHATTTPSSDTYEGVKLPPTKNSLGDYEFRVPFRDNDSIYYRIQVAPFQGEFIWSEERSVSKEAHQAL